MPEDQQRDPISTINSDSNINCKCSHNQIKPLVTLIQITAHISSKYVSEKNPGKPALCTHANNAFHNKFQSDIPGHQFLWSLWSDLMISHGNNKRANILHIYHQYLRLPTILLSFVLISSSIFYIYMVRFKAKQHI